MDGLGTGESNWMHLNGKGLDWGKNILEMDGYTEYKWVNRVDYGRICVFA